MPTDAESFDGFMDGNVGGVVLKGNKVGIVDERLALTVSRDLIARAVGGEAWTEGV